MTRRRVFLVPTRADVPVEAAIDHWEQRHGAVFAATPGLVGYVQHRPTRAEQGRLGGRVCAEAWFADRDAEARAFASDHYRGAVTEDEDRFVDRSRAWTALVRGESVAGAPDGAPLEVVAIGCRTASLPQGTPGRVLELDRSGPDGGPATLVLAAAWDQAAARQLAGVLEADVVFVARRAPVTPPQP